MKTIPLKDYPSLQKPKSIDQLVSCRLKEYQECYGLSDEDIAKIMNIPVDQVGVEFKDNTAKWKYNSILNGLTLYLHEAIATYKKDPTINMHQLFNMEYQIKDIDAIINYPAIITHHANSLKLESMQSIFTLEKFQECVLKAISSSNNKASVARINNLCFMVDDKHYKEHGFTYTGSTYVKVDGIAKIYGIEEMLTYMFKNRIIDRSLDEEGNPYYSVIVNHTYNDVLRVIDEYEKMTTSELTKLISDIPWVASAKSFEYVSFEL